jgi:hypothetical protein
MRFSLLDLLIAIAIETLSMAQVLGAAHWLGFGRQSMPVAMVLTLAVGIPLYLLITPPIYRRFGLLPLCLPACPHCRRVLQYRVLECEWPRATVACGHCEGTCDLWWNQPAAAEISTTKPSLVLSWPQSIGRWRHVTRQETA